jgi:hypothetical protein
MPLWACDVFGSVGKVRETRIMVLVVAGDSVANGCGYGTVMCVVCVLVWWN